MYVAIIRNIKERIKYIYGDNYEFVLKSQEGEGTTITINLPVVAENGENKGEIPPSSDSLYGSCGPPYDNGL